MDNLLFRIEVQGLTEQVKELGRLKSEMSSMAAEVKKLNADYKEGKVTTDQFNREIGILGLKMNACKQETNALARETQATATAFKGAEGSMVRLAQELGNNREKYRALSQAERENVDVGGKLLTTIQAQDTEIKKLDASIGNHQRNVGNYPGLMGRMGQSLASNIPILGQMSGVLGSVKSEMEASTGAVGGMGKGMVLAAGAVGIAIAAFGALASTMGDGIKHAMEEESVQGRLKFALNGNSEAVERLTKWKKVLFENTTISKDEIGNMTNYGLSMGKTEVQTMEMVKASIALSKASLGTIDPMSAMQKLQGTLQGQARGLKQFIGALTTEQLMNGDAIAILNDKYGKFLNTGMSSTAGKLTMAKKEWNEFWEGFGNIALTAFASITTGFKAQRNQFSFIKENFGLLAAWGNFFKGNQITDGKANAEYFTWKKNQLAKIEMIKEENAAKRAGGGSKGVTDEAAQAAADQKAIEAAEKAKAASEKAKAASEKARQEFESNLKTRTDAIKANNDYIQQLARKAIDEEIAAMADGKEKEKAIAKDKYDDDIIAINRERRDRIEAINDVIKTTKATGEQLKTLNAQKVAIADGANKQIESMQAAHDKELNDIDKKYSKEAQDSAITSKYSQDVAKVTEEGQMKLDVLRAFYASKGTLTATEERKLHDEELKLAIDVAQKKYDLLYAEIQQRKSLGTISQEEYDKQLANIARLYGEVKKLGGEQDASKDAGKKKPDAVTGGIMDMFNIPEDQAEKVKQKTAQLLSQLGNMWLNAQKDRINNELKAETKKVDKVHDVALKSLDEQRKKGLITEKQYNDKKDKLDQDAAKKKDELNKQAFEKNKKLQLLNAVINGAMAVIAAAMTPGIGLIMAVLAGLLVAAEIATIAGTKYEGAKGGMLRGPAHSQGGIKYAMGGDVLELEGGEAVINKRAMDSSDQMTVSGTPRQIASRVNSYRGWGVPFAAGGFLPAANPIRRNGIVNASDMSGAISQAINDQKVYIVESEFTEIQGKAKKVQVESVW